MTKKELTIEICPVCTCNLFQKGLVADLYLIICQYFSVNWESFPLFEPDFNEALRYLEINNYVLSTEVYDDILMVKPRLEVLDDGITTICCSGKCVPMKIDFKSEHQ